MPMARPESNSIKFHPLKQNIVKTREVTDYREMQTSQLEDLLYDYQNRMRTETDEDEREWLAGQAGEIQAILDDRSQEECDTEDGEE